MRITYSVRYLKPGGLGAAESWGNTLKQALRNIPKGSVPFEVQKELTNEQGKVIRVISRRPWRIEPPRRRRPR